MSDKRPCRTLDRHRVTMATITAEERAELCRRVSLLDLMTEDGLEVRQAGGHWLVKLRREENTASCRVWAPGTGREGHKGWTYYDFGSSAGGDTIAYLTDPLGRGMAYIDAIRFLAERGGWTPPGLGTANDDTATAPRTAPPRQAETTSAPVMPSDEQADAVSLFLSALCSVDAEAWQGGAKYLRGRGCLPAGWPRGDVVLLRDEAMAPLAERLRGMGKDVTNLLERAGIIRDATGQPIWRDAAALFVCRREDTAPVYLLGRRIHWQPGDSLPKYFNQKTAGGAVRWPFNLPALYATAGQARPQEVIGMPAWPRLKDTALLVEGAADALGAAVLGWPALAMLSRPQARGHRDDSSACMRMLKPHMEALALFRRVLVVPDDDGGGKGDDGLTHAAQLAAALTAQNIEARTATVRELVPHAPHEVKDLADAARASQSSRP